MKTKVQPVTVENFIRAESDTYFKRISTGKGRKLGSIMWRRDVSPVDDQTIVRQNRDTLYGSAVFEGNPERYVEISRDEAGEISSGGQPTYPCECRYTTFEPAGRTSRDEAAKDPSLTATSRCR